jgi:thioredoxin-like negative regulator of GroEL
MGGKAAAAALAAAMPGTPEALYALGVCLASRGRYVQALEHLFLVVEQAPDYWSGVATATILRVLSLAGERNQAAGQYWERLGRALHRPGPDRRTYRTPNRAEEGRSHLRARVDAPERQ